MNYYFKWKYFFKWCYKYRKDIIKGLLIMVTVVTIANISIYLEKKLLVYLLEIDLTRDFVNSFIPKELVTISDKIWYLNHLSTPFIIYIFVMIASYFQNKK